MTVHFLKRGRQKGVFLSLRDWNSIKREIESLQLQLDFIEKRRKEIRDNFRKSKIEKHKFTSRIDELKKALR